MPVDPRPYHLEIDGLTQAPLPAAGVGPTRDPTSSSAAHKGDLGRDTRVLLGRVVDVVAYTHFYKVQLERGAGTISCCAGGSTSFQVMGATQLQSYLPGTAVAVIRHHQLPFGIIVCAIPDWSIKAADGLSDVIVQGSNVGIRSDGVHTFPFSTTLGGGITDFSSRRPGDGLPIGEWGAISENGLAIFLDSLVAYLRVDEETGLFAFYENQLLRVTGHNLQMWSAGWHREDLDDENEWDSEDGWAPYLWEADGVFSADASRATVRTAADVQVDTPYYSMYEPIETDRIPFHRRTEFRGYLGQGGRDALAAPPADISSNRLQDFTVAPGLFEQVLGMDGQLGIRSARGIVIAKDPFISTPKRILRPDSPDGDNTTTYKAAGTFGTGPDHFVTGGPTGATPDTRYLGIMDNYAYLFNWKSPHPFHYHTADWYLPQEADSPAAAGYAAPVYTSLSSSQYLPTPAGISIRIDDRYGTVLCFPNRAMIALTEDGGIVFIDGWGSEYRMMGGEIRQACAGDSFNLPGRNAVTMAGYDVVHRANHSLYGSANWGDVRFKAEKQFMVLAGNDHCGGILLESRAAYPVFEADSHDPIFSGIYLRTRNGPIVLAGQEMLFSTTLLGSSDHPRHIIMDVGSNKIVTNSSTFERRLTKAAIDIFSDGGINEFWSDFAQINSRVVINGPLSYASLEVFDAACATARWATLTTYAGAAAGDITELQNRTEVATALFVWPTATEYHAASFILHEARWQQSARLAGETLPTWTENPVLDLSSNPTYPYPGLESWVDTEGYKQSNPLLYDDVTGVAITRGSTYETAAYSSITSLVLDGNYPVVISLP